MPKFKHYDFNQTAMVVIDYQQQLQPGTFEHAIHFLIHNKLDLSIFNDLYANDDGGRPAYDPAILLSIILFAYSKGITSSREIQWCCETNIIFKALSCDTVPHWTTIAKFVSRYPKKMTDLFEQVLLICHQEGLIGNELFAIDGCKMRSDAAKEWSGTFNELDQKRKKLKRQIKYHITAHKELDKQNTEASEQRKQRTEQTINTLEKNFKKIDQFLKTQSPRMGQGKRKTEVKSNITDNDSAKMTTSKGTIQGYNGVATVDKKHQVIIDATAFGAGQEHHTLTPVMEAVLQRFRRLGISKDIYKENVIVTADTGFANEQNMKMLNRHKINAYIPDNKFRSRDPKFQDQKQKYGKRKAHLRKTKPKSLFPATDFIFDPQTKTCICPAGNKLSNRGERPIENGTDKIYFEGRLSQCKNCSLKHQCMKNPSAADHRKGAGRQVSFIVNKATQSPYTEWMKHRVDSAEGKQIYSHRMSVVEPVFGNIGTNKGLNRFSLRGLEKVNGQWQLFSLIHNIEKLYKYGELRH
ncbi:IS1182 family transposase [Reinekea marinisedimentorum]|uniref:Transposase n=1 Tax=Reinekea marinisedimentorum TaxID=230495 RepID=A0A4R3HQE0_9GAMM|nr:IS1182 family transposase [Reinekea marinisedimentorum]TCS34668.1 transposase [Reinekea marinisedimentorum]